MARLYVAAQELQGVKGQTGLATALGMKPQVINNWETRGISAAGLLLAQRVIGCSATWVESGDGPMALAAGNLVPKIGEGVPVKLLSNTASMGPGEAINEDDVMLGTILLSPQFLQSRIKPTRQDALRFIHAYGDSMEPTFASGDVLLLDTGVMEIKTDGLFVLRAHDRLFVKRVRQRIDGTFEISSDNPAHKTVDTLDGSSDVQIVGRILWVWNGRKL